MSSKKVSLSDFERDVTISVLETALSGWEGDTPRQMAIARVVMKLKEVDERRQQP